MLYTVSEVSDSTGLSKQTIYNKLKLKELQEHISKKQGVTYIDEVGFNLIKDSLKIESNDLNDLKDAKNDNASNEEVAMDVEDLKLDNELFKVLIEQLNRKDKQIEEKDLQIHELHKLIENNQVLLKQEQDKKKQQELIQLEAHFEELDFKLAKIREEMQQRKNKSKLFTFFKKRSNLL